jgi:uncharacterized membrane protein
VVLFYLNADVYLVDSTVSYLSQGWAIAISIGLMAVGWLVYDVVCPPLHERDLLVGTCPLGLVTLDELGGKRAVRASRGLAPGRLDAGDDHGCER